MAKDELKPKNCPFCWSGAILHGKKYETVTCSNPECSAYTYHFYLAEWNHRQLEELDRDRLEMVICEFFADVTLFEMTPELIVFLAKKIWKTFGIKKLSIEKLVEIIHKVEKETNGHYDTTDLAQAILNEGL